MPIFYIFIIQRYAIFTKSGGDKGKHSKKHESSYKLTAKIALSLHLIIIYKCLYMVFV